MALIYFYQKYNVFFLPVKQFFILSFIMIHNCVGYLQNELINKHFEHADAIQDKNKCEKWKETEWIEKVTRFN